MGALEDFRTDLFQSRTKQNTREVFPRHPKSPEGKRDPWPALPLMTKWLWASRTEPKAAPSMGVLPQKGGEQGEPRFSPSPSQKELHRHQVASRTSHHL